MNPTHGRAIVIGGSLAGMLAARVLADHYDHVVILERDAAPTPDQPRRTTPHAAHSHALMAAGAEVFERLFPGYFEAIAPENKATPKTSAWFHFGVWKRQVDAPLVMNFASRAYLEWIMHGRLAAWPTIEVRHGVDVAGLLGDATAVRGVRVREADGAEAELPADLVVDAGGRGTQAPRWLAALGCAAPRETRIAVDLGYATRVVRLEERPRAWQAMVIYAAPPATRRGGALFPIEGGNWLLTLQGYHHEHAPADDAGFLAFAATLDQPHIHDELTRATELGPVASYHLPYYRRRHYERLKRPPAGFLGLGDAITTLDPVYGQGMSVAALQAEALGRCVARGRGPDLPRRFYRAAAAIVADPWLMCTTEDFRYPETQGPRPPGLGLLNAYKGRLMALLASDDVLMRVFYEVVHMRSPAARLFAPDVFFRVVASFIFPAGAPQPAPDRVAVIEPDTETHRRHR